MTYVDLFPTHVLQSFLTSELFAWQMPMNTKVLNYEDANATTKSRYCKMSESGTSTLASELSEFIRTSATGSYFL